MDTRFLCTVSLVRRDSLCIYYKYVLYISQKHRLIRTKVFSRDLASRRNLANRSNAVLMLIMTHK